MEPFFPDNESRLLERVANGDYKAFHQLYDHYRNQVFYFGLKFLKSETSAEDLLQEVFSKIWITRKKLVDLDNFSKYLNTITLNHIYNLLRRKAFEETFLHEQFFKVENNREEAFNCVDLHELEGLLGKAVNQLPPQQKKVFELSRMQGLKHGEIARQLNISGETVKKHIMEALRNVKSYLASHGQTEVSILLLLLFIK